MARTDSSRVSGYANARLVQAKTVIDIEPTNHSPVKMPPGVFIPPASASSSSSRCSR
jgi:hypothetical protein